jgi:hypothetical protein
MENKQSRALSRRDFLKISGLIGASFALGACGPRPKNKLGSASAPSDSFALGIKDERPLDLPTSTPEPENRLVFDENFIIDGQVGEIDGQKYGLNSICGPLAAYILINSGFWPKEFAEKVKPHDFFPGNPESLKRTFKDSGFQYIHFDGPTDTHDFEAEPLELGDFVFLYGPNKNGFAHMLAVTEIDEEGCAWSVTNVMQKDQSFKIQRIKLYNPKVVGTSVLYDPINPNPPLLQSGVGGPYGRTGVKFDVWRPY